MQVAITFFVTKRQRYQLYIMQIFCMYGLQRKIAARWTDVIQQTVGSTLHSVLHARNGKTLYVIKFCLESSEERDMKRQRYIQVCMKCYTKPEKEYEIL